MIRASGFQVSGSAGYAERQNNLEGSIAAISARIWHGIAPTQFDQRSGWHGERIHATPRSSRPYNLLYYEQYEYGFFILVVFLIIIH